MSEMYRQATYHVSNANYIIHFAIYALTQQAVWLRL